MTWLHTRRIPVLLAAATLLPIAALCWLGIRTILQDRDLERHRRRQAVEVAAGRLALEVDHELRNVEERLAAGTGVRLRASGIESADTVAPILYQPEETLALDTADGAMSGGAVAEFQRHDLDAAATAYRRLATSGSAETRASALIALARVLRGQGQHEAALTAYAALESLGRTRVAGQPASLVALQGRCKVFEEMKHDAALKEAARVLGNALTHSWPIDRATFELYRDMTVTWGGPIPTRDDIARTDAAIELWRTWRRGSLAPRGRSVSGRGASAVLIIWVTTAAGPVAWLTPTQRVQRSWEHLWEATHLTVAASTVDGEPLFGSGPADGVMLPPGDTHLPFLLTVSSNIDADRVAWKREAPLLAGVGLTLALMLGAVYGLHRVTARELQLARQQSDFVAAVSHEFRTPLTSMRHLTDLLATRGGPTAERRAHYYRLLANETERLHRMVESLLSFGRMDAGVQTWKHETVDVAALVRDVVDNFQPEAMGRRLSCDVAIALPSVAADREALACAVRNLLENAGKYSRSDTPIDVFAHREDGRVLISVRDQGVGIPRGEQQRIFDKFVRGSDATRSGIRGVGIGLTLVKRIVESHGGSVRVESEPGRGSTFTLVIPCRES